MGLGTHFGLVLLGVALGKGRGRGIISQPGARRKGGRRCQGRRAGTVPKAHGGSQVGDREPQQCPSPDKQGVSRNPTTCVRQEEWGKETVKKVKKSLKIL